MIFGAAAEDAFQAVQQNLREGVSQFVALAPESVELSRKIVRSTVIRGNKEKNYGSAPTADEKLTGRCLPVVTISVS